MLFADDARRILQNLPMRQSKPVLALLAGYKRHWKLMASETTTWLHDINGDPVVGRSKQQMDAEIFEDEADEDALDEPGMEGNTAVTPRDRVEVVIEDPPSLGMQRPYLDGLSEIEFSVSSQVSRHCLVAIRWQIN